MRGAAGRITLADYYFDDPRVILIPIEHLAPGGVTAEFAALLTACGWDQQQVDRFNAAFSLYWMRAMALASRTHTYVVRCRLPGRRHPR